MINFEKLVQARIKALVNLLNCYLLPDEGGLEQGSTGGKSLISKDAKERPFVVLYIHFHFNRLLCIHSLVSLYHPQVTWLAQIHNKPRSVMQDLLYTLSIRSMHTHTLIKTLLCPSRTLCSPADQSSLGYRLQPTFAYEV